MPANGARRMACAREAYEVVASVAGGADDRVVALETVERLAEYLDRQTGDVGSYEHDATGCGQSHAESGIHPLPQVVPLLWGTEDVVAQPSGHCGTRLGWVKADGERVCPPPREGKCVCHKAFVEGKCRLVTYGPGKTRLHLALFRKPDEDEEPLIVHGVVIPR